MCYLKLGRKGVTRISSGLFWRGQNTRLIVWCDIASGCVSADILCNMALRGGFCSSSWTNFIYLFIFCGFVTRSMVRVSFTRMPIQIWKRAFYPSDSNSEHFNRCRGQEARTHAPWNAAHIWIKLSLQMLRRTRFFGGWGALRKLEAQVLTMWGRAVGAGSELPN